MKVTERGHELQSNRTPDPGPEHSFNPVATLSKLRARQIVSAANSARDSRRFDEAATLYAKAAKSAPRRADIQIQLGNMLKDTGQYQAAVHAYERGHNLLVRQLRRAQPSQREKLASAIGDVYVQLGHLFKKAGMRGYAVKYYKDAYAFTPRPDIKEEITLTQITANGILEQNLSITPPNLAVSDINDILASASAINISDYLSDHRQCLCWSRNYTVKNDDTNLQICICANCGTEYADEVTIKNMKGETNDLAPCPISLADVDEVLTAAGLNDYGKSVGLAGALLNAAPPPDRRIDYLPITNRGIAAGFNRCAYDIVIVWDISRGVTDVRHLLDQAFRVLRPAGHLCLGHRAKLHLPVRELATTLANALKGDPRAEARRSGKETAEGAERPYFVFNETTLIRTLDPIGREAKILPPRLRRNDGLSFIYARKSGKMSVGVMSGIGDAVWSFVIADAVKAKFGASELVYYVHDSGDNRRKRSNNMLARFDFVSDLVSDVFHIHADTPMNAKTGHLNYVEGGEVPLDSPDNFDYRMIINTHLEHGKSYDEICEEMGLDPAQLNYDFFRGYREHDSDLNAVSKVMAQLSEKYVIFYYGALIDNSESGLNRGGIWTPEDWNTLGRLIHEEYGCKIALIGAPYDLDFAKKVQNGNQDLFYVNTIGQLDITETLALIQRSQFIVSFPAGVGIVGPYMRVPTVIFWRPKHMSYHVMHDRAGFDPKFATNWVPPKVLASGGYYPAWYGSDTPSSIMKAIKRGGWWDRTIATRSALGQTNRSPGDSHDQRRPSMLIVTGAAGFIGSVLAATLRRAGHDRVVIVDRLEANDKWRNLQKDVFFEFVFPENIGVFLDRYAGEIECVFHMGAISATTARDGDEILNSNLHPSVQLWRWCAEHGRPFIYASSAATYGDGAFGFEDRDDDSSLARLRPLNLYGWSKHAFDRWAVNESSHGRRPPFWAGLKFFNVYGPNEYHKDDMKSVVAKNYDVVRSGEKVRLFRSHRDEFADGEQLRDFVYVRDCVDIAAWLYDKRPQSGLFNVGSGQARSFNDLISAIAHALETPAYVEYVDMPLSIRDKYQYYTKSNMEKLRRSGYTKPLTTLEDGVSDYVLNHLSSADPFF